MHLFRRLSIFLIVWAASFSTYSAARTPETINGRVRLSVFNDAGLSTQTLVQAASRATFILAQAGVELDWIDCGRPDPADFSPRVAPCSALAWPHQLSVRIRPHGRSVGADIFGQAFLDDAGCGVYSNVYYNNLAANRGHTQLSEGDMLGFVIAHEVGHLLLGTNSHSNTGVMQAHWNASILHDAAHNTLFFTSSQSATLRSRLSAAPIRLP